MADEEKNRKSPEFEYSNTKDVETGIRIFTVTSSNTPYELHIPEINPEFDPLSAVAVVAAYTSRRNDSYIHAYADLNEKVLKDKEAAAKGMENIVNGYGHASVADMAVVPIHMNKIPIKLAYEIWSYITVGAGQESSTRYIPFDALESVKLSEMAPLSQSLELGELSKEEAQPIIDSYEVLNNRMRELYLKWTDNIKGAFGEKFPGVSEKTLNSRTFDISRQWLPLGTFTSMSLVLSVRNWAGLLKNLRESNQEDAMKLADQIEYTLKLDEHGADISQAYGKFLRHDEATHTVENNLDDLKTYLLENTNIGDLLDKQKIKQFEVRESKVKMHKVTNEGLYTAMQYVMRIFPTLSERQILKWLRKLPKDQQAEISTIIYNNHTDHDEMGSMGDLRGTNMFSIDLPISAARDLIRHRAFGRYLLDFTFENPFDLLNQGFVKNFTLFNTDGERFKKMQKEWIADATMLYSEIADFIYLVQEKFPNVDGNWLLNILPLGHMSKLQMSGSVEQLIYLISLREKRGGDYEYVKVVQDMLKLLKNSDTFNLGILPNVEDLNVNSKEEFKTRS